MSDRYMRDVLRLAVAQVCLTIGYHVIQGTPLELLQDILHKFLKEFARDLKRQVEHYNRTEANMDDTFITLRNLDININELLDYMYNVEPVQLAIDLPKFPAHKNTNLNFLKPGSKEVLIRPVHIYEYLPPMLQSNSSTYKLISNSLTIQVPKSLERYQITCGNSVGAPMVSNKRLLESMSGSELSTVCLKTPASCTLILDDEGRPTREISSVVMTTGGFISPAIEGKVADTLIPKFVEKLLGLDSPPALSPPPTPIGEMNRAKDRKQHGNDTVIGCSSQSDKMSTIRTQLLEGDRRSICLGSHSKECLTNRSAAVSDIVNSIVPKKSVQSHITQHVMQVPTLASKLLKKAKKKNVLNFQNSLTSNPNGPEQYNAEATFVSYRAAATEKTQRKSKKNVQKMFKTEIDPSAMSSDYSNTVLQRLKIEKFIKKQSKYQKKLLHRQKNSNQTKNNSNTSLTTISQNELSLPISDPQLPTDVPFMEDSIPVRVSHEGAQTCLTTHFSLSPQPSPAPQSIMQDNISNDDSRNINEVGIGNTQMPAIVTLSYDKRSLPGAKLSAELDRNKLNIFKKISKPKTQKSPNINHITNNNGHLISLPCGTTITPAPTTSKRLIFAEGSLVSTELTENSLNALLNCDFRGSLDLSNSSSPGDIKPNVLSNTSSHVEGLNKPKKRGRKPGSKNLPKPAMVTPKNITDIAHSPKVKKFKNFKYDYSYPLLFENANLVSDKMNTGIASNNLIPNISHGEYVGTSDLAAKYNRKERKKTKSKSLTLNMSTESNLFKTDAEGPSKEEVNTINKKLMRMDTVLESLGTLNQEPIETDIDITKSHITKSSSYKSSTSKKRSSSQGSLLQQPDSNLIPILPSSKFLPAAGLVKMPDLLKLCPFPPGPGLIPPTAQNLLFPRLRPSIPLTLPNFQPYGVIKPINPESPPNYLDPFLSQRSAERNYCSVPPFVPESMKLAPISEIKKSERDCPRTSKFQQSNTEGEKIPKTPDTWETHEKTTPTPTGGIPIKACEPHLQSELPIKSPNASTENQPFSGGMFSPNTSPNTALVKSSIVTPMLNTDDPIELSDDSVDCSSTTVLDMLSSNNRKELNLLFPQMEDYMSISNDPTSCRDQKKSKKTNKFIKNSKNKISIPTDNLPQLDLLSTEKGGVGKLAGGSDLIPLISTGSAYSAKTIPSTSLTATVASSFSLSKSDIYPSNAFENSLSSTNIEGNEVFSLNMELLRKKKDHKRLKKLKEDKVKKKKDKRSKNRERLDHPDKGLHWSEKSCKDKLKEALHCNEDQQEIKKDLLKKLKKDKKKKYKQLIKDSIEQANITQVMDSIEMGGVTKSTNTVFLFGGALQNIPNITSSTQTFVPKLTLKLNCSQSPTPVDDIVQKNSSLITSIAANEYRRKKEPSPELARISPLITRPPKQKFGIAETLTSSMNINQSASISAIASNTNNSVVEKNVNALITPKNSNVHSIAPPPSPWSSGGTISASSVLLPQQLLQSSKIQEQLSHNSSADGGLILNATTASRQFSSADHQSPVPLISETSRPSSYIDVDGNRVWICPAAKDDNGSPMIGCDGCDAWYYLICVEICVAPKDEDCFRRVCITRKEGVHATDKKRKRNKKTDQGFYQTGQHNASYRFN
ncbi:transcription initiation factor TFIID subunit 3 isoform X3 [Ceratitis capitata]|uniref:transcription initiation factor TFIID subunit 3 isoform X3 n=1 Tax=Ceratitis capitata TaxID=7213 RepID=UPI000C6C788F|nr:transcription initiation factor TFIID subunit 3 isoform X3 [Ceratitis capitata]